MAIYDLQTGVSGLTGKPIQNPLVGYPAVLYVWLRRDIPRLAEALFPEDFAAGVKTFIEEVNATLQAERSTAPAPKETPR